MASTCGYCRKQLEEGEDPDVHAMTAHMPPSPALHEWKAERSATSEKRAA